MLVEELMKRTGQNNGQVFDKVKIVCSYKEKTEASHIGCTLKKRSQMKPNSHNYEKIFLNSEENIYFQ